MPHQDMHDLTTTGQFVDCTLTAHWLVVADHNSTWPYARKAASIIDQLRFGEESTCKGASDVS